MSVPEPRVPRTPAALSALLAEAHATGTPLSISGAGTKLGWNVPFGPVPEEGLSLRALDAEIIHHGGDRLVEVDAGTPLARLQNHLAESGQMVGLDPPDSQRATVGGILATADTGPWAHRYGPASRQIRALHIALADGCLLRTGPPLGRPPAGPDVTKLFCGSRGTLGVIASATLTLVPRPEQTATAMGVLRDAVQLADALRELHRAGLELQAIDVAWRRGRGGLLTRAAGPHARRHAERAATILGAAGLAGTDVREQDAGLWERQRAGQRSSQRALVRLTGSPGQLPGWLALADRCGATLIGRAALGIAFLELDPERLDELRRAMPTGGVAELRDRPAPGPLDAHADSDVEIPVGAARAEILADLKRRLDPRAILNPHINWGASRRRPGAV